MWNRESRIWNAVKLLYDLLNCMPNVLLNKELFLHRYKDISTRNMVLFLSVLDQINQDVIIAAAFYLIVKKKG